MRVGKVMRAHETRRSTGDVGNRGNRLVVKHCAWRNRESRLCTVTCFAFSERMLQATERHVESSEQEPPPNPYDPLSFDSWIVNVFAPPLVVGLAILIKQS